MSGVTKKWADRTFTKVQKERIKMIPLGIIEGCLAIRHTEPASVGIAQAILESGWFKSGLWKQHLNAFGHKWVESSIAKGKIPYSSLEYDKSGRGSLATSFFCEYESAKQCLEDHERIMKLKYYRPARRLIANPKGYAKALSGVYATDPKYGNMLIELMDRLNLYAFDQKELTDGEHTETVECCEKPQP